MAKNDKKKQQQQLDDAKNKGNQGGNDIKNSIIPVNQDAQNNLTNANNQAFADYHNIMDQYQNTKLTPFVPITANTYNADKVNYSRTPEFNEGLGYYRDFAKTGGLSGDDRYNLQARGISPIRSVYSNIENELTRQKALNGGYAPGLGAASVRLAREGSQQIADRVNDVNAQIAQMVQQGKMFGTQGFGNMSQRDLELMTQTALQNSAAENNARQFNSSSINNVNQFNSAGQLQNDANKLNLINGQANMYSATPGLSNTFANQVNSSFNQWLASQGLLNDVNQNAVNNQTTNSQIPSNFNTALGNIGQLTNIAGKVISPFLTGGVSNMLPNIAKPVSPYYTGPQL